MTTEIVRNIPIRRMDCPTCVLTLEKAIKKIPGVKDATGNYLKKKSGLSTLSLLS